MERTKKALPTVKLIIGEPFAVPGVYRTGDGVHASLAAARLMAKALFSVFK